MNTTKQLKGKGKGKRKGKEIMEDEEDYWLKGPRHNKPGQLLSSLHRDRTVDALSEVSQPQMAIYKYCIKSGGREVLFKDDCISVSGLEFGFMDMDVHHKDIDAWSNVLNRNEQHRSTTNPNRLFMYVHHMVRKNIITET